MKSFFAAILAAWRVNHSRPTESTSFAAGSEETHSPHMRTGAPHRAGTRVVPEDVSTSLPLRL